jgi:hypothetical protein
MKTRFALVAALAALALLPLAPVYAQPGPEPTPAPPTPAEPAQAPALDEAKIKEIVDAEMARVLNDRAAKEAAERAAREQAEKEAPAAEGPTDLTGASGFFDTRIAFTITNENLLVEPGETIPSVPGWRFGVPNSLGVLFFDNYDTRYSGFETLSHAVMYRNYHKGHFDADGALVLRINELSEKNIELSDAGTYITLSNWKDPTHKDPTRISLTVFPVSSDRMRLGYSYRLSWGGSPEYRRARSATPGMKFQYDAKNMYAFVGAKSAILLDRRTAEEQASLAVLAGAGVDPTDMVRFEVNGGYFDRGYNELVDVNDQKVQLFGLSAQLAVHKGMPVQSSVDYKLYKNNNERVSGLFNPVKYPGGLSWLAMVEFTALGQTLKDPEMTGTTTVQKGYAGDVNVRVMIDRFRIRFDASYRTLAFILHSQPSLPTYSDFPADYDTAPNLFASLGIDRNFNDFITLGAIFGVDKPATLTSEKGVPGGMMGVVGESTAVIRNNNIDTLITILPADCDDGAGFKACTAVPQFALKGYTKLDFGRIYTALLEVFYSYDANTTRYQRVEPGNPESPFEFQFGEFNQLGVNATLQARF